MAGSIQQDGGGTNRYEFATRHMESYAIPQMKKQ